MAEIIVRRRRVIDDLNRRRLLIALEGVFNDDVVLQAETWDWASLTTVTESAVGYYAMPNPNGSAESTLASFNAYLELDAELATQWKEAYQAAQTPLNDVALIPPEKLPAPLSEDQKKSDKKTA